MNMKKILFWLVLLFTAYNPAALCSTTIPASLLIKINMLYNAQNQQGLPLQSNSHNILRLNTNDKHWTTLNVTDAEDKLKNPQVFLLQGKIEKVTESTAAIQFLIFDLNNQSNAVLTSKMIVRYGQEGKIQIHENHRDVQLTLVATR
jgi:hypothetical protein